MAIWTFYFLAKIFLYVRGAIRFNVLLNLLLLGAAALPLPRRFAEKRTLRAVRFSALAFFGVLLLWHDSWLPAPLEAAHMLSRNGMPSAEYITGFLGRFFDLHTTVILLVLLAASVAARRYRKSLLVASTLLVLAPLAYSPEAVHRRSDAEIETALASFTNAESTRLVYFTPSSAKPDFDILILQICSLSWDDLRDLGMRDQPFFKGFDIVFDGFNSVSTYSNPSAIRLLNADCGQRRHADLYGNLPQNCSLMDSLRSRGYAIAFGRNHNGKYGHFDEEVKNFGRLAASPLEPIGLAADRYMFDDTPVYDDYAVLEQWWHARGRGGPGTALYYNTVSLHDGTHRTADKDWWKKDHREQYRDFLNTLLNDMERFVRLLSASGRKVLLVVIGEHGRAVRGGGIETPGLRDIPLPRVTLVPVGIKLIGRERPLDPSGKAVVVSGPTSYLALSSVLEAFTRTSPFDADFALTRGFLDNIPRTKYVSENESNLIVRMDDEYYLYGKEKKWILLSPGDLN